MLYESFYIIILTVEKNKAYIFKQGKLKLIKLIIE